MSDQLQMFEESSYQQSMSSPSEALVFSLAGKRKGMEGARSSLILEAIRLINECRPRVFIWENVKGTFSSNDGEDFAAILKAFADIGGYRLEWQLCNTSWFLPQNRERIYLSKKMADFLIQRQGKQKGNYKVGDLDLHEQ